jgi:hypothetical protein
MGTGLRGIFFKKKKKGIHAACVYESCVTAIELLGKNMTSDPPA